MKQATRDIACASVIFTLVGYAGHFMAEKINFEQKVDTNKVNAERVNLQDIHRCRTVLAVTPLFQAAQMSEKALSPETLLNSTSQMLDCLKDHKTPILHSIPLPRTTLALRWQ